MLCYETTLDYNVLTFTTRNLIHIKPLPPSLPPPPPPPPQPKKPRRLCEMPARQVAEELLLWDAEMLRRIAPLELEGGAWMKKNKVGDGRG